MIVPTSLSKPIGTLWAVVLLMLVSGTARGHTSPPATTGNDAREVALEPRGAPSRFALVIGSNDTSSPKQARLRFADDDAARMAELLEELGFDVEVVTELDQETQEVFADLARRARRPTKENVRAAYAGLVRRMEDARKQGAGSIDLLIYYSGHGDVGPDGKGYLTLAGGKLTRHDLFAELLGKSPADFNHLVVDACRSEEFVLSRGEDWKPDRSAVDYSRSVQRYLDRHHLGSFPNTGVVLASSADQQTHEWERFRGGVFSHELLSGLRGGADLNGDGHIEYSELGAFVSAANSGVKDPRARLKVVVRPPQGDGRHPVLSHDRIANRRVLLFSADDIDRYTVEDSRGIRLADLHRSGGRPGYLRLPEGDLFVYRELSRPDQAPVIEESPIPARQGGVIAARQLAFAKTTRGTRGALDQAFRQGLFTVPYGLGYYSGYTDMHGLLAVEDPDWQVRVWREVDGELVEITTTATADEDESEEKDEDEKLEPCPACEDEDDDDDDDFDWYSRQVWGAISVGTLFTPFSPEGQIQQPDNRVISNQFVGKLGNATTTPLRGFDLRWHTFWLKKRHRQRKAYPRTQWYFRTGYTQGYAEFLPPEGESFLVGEATSLSYLTVPLFLGGNIYVFDEFPLRPYAGMGFGFDILRVEYPRVNRDNLVDVSARIGFELHAGIELRITNYVSLMAEVMQLWSARRKLTGVPDYSNEGFTVITSVAAGFPLHKRNERNRAKVARRKKNREEARRRAARKHAEEERRKKAKPGAVRVQVKDGDDTVVVEAAKGKKKKAGDQPAAEAAPTDEAAPGEPTDTAAAPDRDESPDARTAVEKAVEEADKGNRR